MNYSRLLAWTVVFLSFLFSFYYLFFLSPRLVLIGQIDKTQSYLKSTNLYLLQNRISLTELARLDNNSGDFNGSAAYLIRTIKETNSRGLESLKSQHSLSNLKDAGVSDKSINKLSDSAKSFFSDQERFVNDLLKEEDFSKKLSLLKSKRSVSLLTREGNLILEYNLWIDKLENLKKTSKIF